MMKSTLRTSRIVSHMLNKTISFKFCLGGWAPLDPRKHTTMAHNSNNMYLDLYQYGHYPDWYHICSVAPTTYQTKVVDIITQTINARYGTQITSEFLLSKKFREWNRFLSKDLKVQQKFHDIYPTILRRLSSGIFVKQSRFTWIKQQEIRFDYTLGSFDADTPKTIEQFLERYNEEIEFLTLISNLGFAAQIDQEESALEKHLQQQSNQLQLGVSELKNLSKQHDNFINRLLAFIH